MALALRHDDSVTWRGRHPGTLIVQNGREPVFGGVAYVGLFEGRLLTVGAPEDLPSCGTVWVRGDGVPSPALVAPQIVSRRCLLCVVCWALRVCVCPLAAAAAAALHCGVRHHCVLLRHLLIVSAPTPHPPRGPQIRGGVEGEEADPHSVPSKKGAGGDADHSLVPVSPAQGILLPPLQPYQTHTVRNAGLRPPLPSPPALCVGMPGSHALGTSPRTHAQESGFMVTTVGCCRCCCGVLRWYPGAAVPVL